MMQRCNVACNTLRCSVAPLKRGCNATVQRNAAAQQGTDRTRVGVLGTRARPRSGPVAAPGGALLMTSQGVTLKPLDRQGDCHAC
jgi:hypothetical protein